MKILFDYFDDPNLDPEQIVDEVHRVADILEEGYTSGELTAAPGRGWWSVEKGE